MTYNIKSERVRIGLSQEDVAERLGVHVNSVRLWESNSIKPSSLNLIELSKLFGCTPDYLLGITEERTAAALR